MTMNQRELEKYEARLISHRRQMFSSFEKFRQFYFPEYHPVEDAVFHPELVQTLNWMSAARGSKIAIAAPRGSAKSTIISMEYIIYSICLRLEDFILLVSSTAGHAEESLAIVKRELESNERLRKDFPEVCELDKKPEPRRWARHEIITKNGVRVTALGVGQNIRGKRHNQHRPTLIILDDLEGNEMVQNEDSRYKLVDWFEKSVLKAGYNRTNFIFAGTIHHYGSLLAQYTDPSQAPGWQKRIYRSIIKWSEAANEWQAWANIFRGTQEYGGESGPEVAKAFFEANRDRMLAGTEVLWPQRESYYDLMAMREQEGEISFDSEKQNEPVNPRDCFFRVEDMQFWDDKYPDEAALLKSMPYPMIYAACDPSMGKSKTHGDFSAIITGVYNTANKTLYVLDADMERRQPENLIEALLGCHKSRDIQVLGVESNGFQELLVDLLKQRAAKDGIHLSIDEIKNDKDKIARIQALQPFIKAGKIQFRRKHRALVEQLKYFPKGKHDDGPDALEMLYQLASQHVDWNELNKGLARLTAGLIRNQWF